MLKAPLVEETAEDRGQAIKPSQTLAPLEAVLQLINRLVAAEMLKAAFPPPGKWILHSEVANEELAGLLQKHLSKTGWRRVIEAMHRHNRHNGDPLWDLSQPADFVAAVQQALAHWEAAGGEPATDEWAPEMWRQVKALMEATLKPVGVTDWLLSPRAMISRLSARARLARTERQIESAVSEAAMQAAQVVGTDTERDVALQRVEQLRDKLGDQLQVFCTEYGLPLPQPYSREEAYCLHLLNAYFVALVEAEGAIAKRGATLARRQIDLEGERAEARLDMRLLPGLVEGRREVNPLRESLFRERMRHRLALVMAGIFGALWGAVWGVVESLSDLLVGAIVRYPGVVAPALLVGLLTLVAQTASYGGPFTLAVAAEFLSRALWNGLLALSAAILFHGCCLYYRNQRQGRDSDPSDCNDQHPPGTGDSHGASTWR